MNTPQRKPLTAVACFLGLAIIACLFVEMAPNVKTGALAVGALAVGMAVSANQVAQRQDGCTQKYLVAASTHIYDGTLVFADATGYAVDVTASGVNRFAGVARDEYDNSSGAAGDKQAELWTRGTFTLTGSGFTQASVKLKVYATDNYTVTTNASAPNAVYIGVCQEYISATKIAVAIDPVDDRADGGSVAAAGSAQGDATQLTYGVNSVSGADATKGVLLPPCSAGRRVVVYNEHASNGLKIYPATGEDINDGTANAAITIEGKTVAEFVGIDASTWGCQFTVNV